MPSKRALELVQEGFASVSEAARFLTYEETKIYEMLNNHVLPFARPGRKRLIPWIALKEYAADLLDKINDFGE